MRSQPESGHLLNSSLYPVIPFPRVCKFFDNSLFSTVSGWNWVYKFKNILRGGKRRIAMCGTRKPSKNQHMVENHPPNGWRASCVSYMLKDILRLCLLQKKHILSWCCPTKFLFSITVIVNLNRLCPELTVCYPSTIFIVLMLSWDVGPLRAAMVSRCQHRCNCSCISLVVPPFLLDCWVVGSETRMPKETIWVIVAELLCSSGSRSWCH